LFMWNALQRERDTREKGWGLERAEDAARA
jgi:hypothetical protein